MLRTLGSTGGGGSGFTSWNEVPSGTQNGVNKVFTLAASPSSSNTIFGNFNGQQLTYNGGDFTVSGNTVTMTNIAPNSGNTPADVLLFSYS